ncbi:MAG: tRNA dimethylallyltransferase, partial [Clostridia bacterium]
PPTAQRLHLNDKKRIVRALEVYACSGKPLSAYGNDFNGTSTATALYPSAILGLKIERAALVCRIHQRVDEMMRQGLLDEVERLWNVGYPRTLPAMQSIGYKQLFSYLDGDCTLEMAVAQIKQDTSRFAKRQMTWFRRDERIQWIDVTAFNNDKLSEIEQTAKEMLQE